MNDFYLLTSLTHQPPANESIEKQFLLMENVRLRKALRVRNENEGIPFKKDHSLCVCPQAMKKKITDDKYIREPRFLFKPFVRIQRYTPTLPSLPEVLSADESDQSPSNLKVHSQAENIQSKNVFPQLLPLDRAVDYGDYQIKRTDIENNSEDEDPSTTASTPSNTPIINPHESQVCFINQNQLLRDTENPKKDAKYNDCITPSTQCKVIKSTNFMPLINNGNKLCESIKINCGLDSPPTERENNDDDDEFDDKEMFELSKRDFEYIQEGINVCDQIEEDCANLGHSETSCLYQDVTRSKVTDAFTFETELETSSTNDGSRDFSELSQQNGLEVPKVSKSAKRKIRNRDFKSNTEVVPADSTKLLRQRNWIISYKEPSLRIKLRRETKNKIYDPFLYCKAATLQRQKT